MKQVTAGWVLAQVDELLPNACSESSKYHWLEQAEAFCRAAAGMPAAEMLTEETALTVPVPFDGLYSRYLEAQISYAGGEVSRYNNAMAAWNELFLAWRDWRSRGSAAPAAALKLC